MWVPFLVAGLTILFLFIIPHFIGTYWLFKKYFCKKPEEEINKYFLTSPNYEQVREGLVKDKFAIEELPHEILEITSFDNLKLRGIYFPRNGKKTVILVHGFHANPVGIFASTARRFVDKGFNVLIISQRSHSLSEGKYISFGLYEHRDLQDWVEYVKTHFNHESIYLYGMSMGGATVCLASEKLDENVVKGLIVECAYPSLTDLIKQLATSLHVPAFLFLSTLELYCRCIIKLKFSAFDTRESLKNNKIPTMFIVGENDNIATVDFLMQNYNCCSSKKDYIIVPNARHAIAMTLGGDETFNKMLDFFKGE